MVDETDRGTRPTRRDPRLNADSWIDRSMPPNAVQTCRPACLRVDAQVLRDLHAQFARRHDDQPAQSPVRHRTQLVEHRQTERGGLAAAGLAEADQFLTVAGSWEWRAPGCPSAVRSRRRARPSGWTDSVRGIRNSLSVFFGCGDRRNGRGYTSTRVRLGSIARRNGRWPTHMVAAHRGLLAYRSGLCGCTCCVVAQQQDVRIGDLLPRLETRLCFVDSRDRSSLSQMLGLARVARRYRQRFSADDPSTDQTRSRAP